MHLSRSVAFILAALLGSVALAQYPQLPPEETRIAEERKAAANARSDEAFARAIPIIEQQAKEGRPFIPSARRPEDLPQARIPAFPGAWGGGMYSFGGRGGKVYVVTSLEDSGPGTFREACEAGGARIVVFNVAGIIQLEDRIRIRAPYITIAGNTAPGYGVCIAGNTVEIETHDVIIRHMRFRRGSTDAGDRNDSLGGNPVGNIMIDHVSASWGLDENLSMYRHMYTPSGSDRALKLPTVNITIQNCIVSEGLNIYNHAFGSTLGGRNTMFHHNLYASNTGRVPSIGMGGDFSWVNNTIFNWRHRTMDGIGAGSRLNVINNYMKPGPATPLESPVRWRLVRIEGLDREGHPEPAEPTFHIAGNVIEGQDEVTRDNWAGGVQVMDRDDAERDPAAYERAQRLLPMLRRDEPNPMPPVPIQSAEKAFEWVIAHAGATLPRRDAVDQRIADMVRSGKVTADPNIPADVDPRRYRYTQEFVDRQRDYIALGIITHPDQVGGYPTYIGEPYADADSDGMPDEWELRHGLNPNDPSDAAGDINGDGYTNIEKFIHNIDPAKKIDWTDLRNNRDTLAEQQTVPGTVHGLPN